MAIATHRVVRAKHGPLVATAIHDGHAVRPLLQQSFAINAEQRLREEDPYTGLLTQVGDTQIVGLRSRFEVDLNRSRDKAVYIDPADAWGIDVWQKRPDREMIGESLREYDEFYSSVEALLDELVRDFGRVVVFDIHSYNHRRAGASEAAADPSSNPEINIGTGTMDRGLWLPVVERFIDDLRSYKFRGRGLDVRENVKFRGGHFARWIHENFTQQVCAISIEFKKFFMDEWTGECNIDEVMDLVDLLRSTVPGVLSKLDKM